MNSANLRRNLSALQYQFKENKSTSVDSCICEFHVYQANFYPTELRDESLQSSLKDYSWSREPDPFSEMVLIHWRL